jgi:hypothetical protein
LSARIIFMKDSRTYTACCGLYCRDCIPSRESLFTAVRELSGELDTVDFARYAALKAEGDEAFAPYEQFRRYLDAIGSLQCPGPCSEGGGKPDCAIRSCAHKKGYTGCWECAGFEVCELLIPFTRFHGDTPVTNLRLIREHGVGNWAQHRGPHYRWSKRP